MKNFKIFNLIGDIDLKAEESLSNFLNEMMETPDVAIVIAINSPGGDADIGFNLYNKLRAVPNPLYTVITGACHSIANIVFLAAEFENRFYFPFTSFFMHPARMYCNHNSVFSPENLNKELDELEQINQKIYTIFKSCNIESLDDELQKLFLQQKDELKLYTRDFEYYKIGKLIEKYSDIPM